MVGITNILLIMRNALHVIYSSAMKPAIVFVSREIQKLPYFCSGVGFSDKGVLHNFNGSK